jgi:hypothetical protein
LEENRPGLGAHLYQSLGGRIPVTGVAKPQYLGAENVQEIARASNLYISASLDKAFRKQSIMSFQCMGRTGFPRC